MANKRMFSIKIIDTDLFLDMPVSTRLLYYDFAMRADDDGFVGSPKKITKMVGCSDDDLKLLCAKQFLIPFESGVCVIRDWKIHNTIQKDRYVKTQYTDEKNQLNTDFNGAYTLCIQDGNSLDTQIRLDKTRLEQDKIRLDKTNIIPITSYFEENIGAMTSIVLSDVLFFLKNNVEVNLIVACLTKSVEINARCKWKYAKGILNNLLTTGVITLEAFEKKELERVEQFSTNVKHNDTPVGQLTGVTYL